MAKVQQTTKKKAARKTTSARKPATKKAATKPAPAAEPEPKPEPKKATGNGARGPTGRPEGKTTGLGVQAAWVHIFQENEKAAKSKKLTDEQITGWMHAEFPGRGSKVFDHVQPVRTKYNKGGLTGKEVPAVQSHRYDESGDVVPPRAAPGSKRSAKQDGKAA